jgi:hypothetical protein
MADSSYLHLTGQVEAVPGTHRTSAMEYTQPWQKLIFACGHWFGQDAVMPGGSVSVDGLTSRRRCPAYCCKHKLPEDAVVRLARHVATLG